MDLLLFDLDNTLYSPEKKLFSLIDGRINRYMVEVVGISPEEVDELRKSYWMHYGVTMRGLMKHHGVDPEDYLAFVHDVQVSDRLHPNPVLREKLASIPLRKVVFTNSSRDHSERVLSALGLTGVFEEIFDIRIAHYLPKPSPEPYHAVLDRTDVPASRCVMVEDSVENLKTAKDLGMGTILVGTIPSAPHVDVRIPSIVEIPDALTHWSPQSSI